jgi:hypothetical protein
MILISCNKDSEDVLTNKIMYIDLNPDITLHPVDSIGLHPSGLCQEIIPFPSDSTVIVNLDINQDGVNDFRFTYSTFYEWVSASSPCSNYNSTLQVDGLSSTNKIKVENEDKHEVSILENGDVINTNQLFANNAILYRDNTMSFLNFGEFSDERFIGIKLSSGELGWIKLNFQKNSFTCTILECGYNETKNAQITAGQIE